MSRVAIGALLAALVALPATAAQFAEIDTNGDAKVAFEELTAVYADVTEDAFSEMDTDGDSFLNEEEMTAAIEDGLIVEASE